MSFGFFVQAGLSLLGSAKNKKKQKQAFEQQRAAEERNRILAAEQREDALRQSRLLRDNARHDAKVLSFRERKKNLGDKHIQRVLAINPVAGLALQNDKRAFDLKVGKMAKDTGITLDVSDVLSDNFKKEPVRDPKPSNPGRQPPIRRDDQDKENDPHQDRK